MEQKRVLIDDPDTNWIIKGLGDDLNPFSSTNIGMICENEPAQDCGGDYSPKYHRKAKSSHKQNARKSKKRK